MTIISKMGQLRTSKRKRLESRTSQTGRFKKNWKVKHGHMRLYQRTRKKLVALNCEQIGNTKTRKEFGF